LTFDTSLGLKGCDLHAHWAGSHLITSELHVIFGLRVGA